MARSYGTAYVRELQSNRVQNKVRLYYGQLSRNNQLTFAKCLFNLADETPEDHYLVNGLLQNVRTTK